jgi:hypothetical protein
LSESETEVVQSATLIIHGEDLEPSEVSQALRLTPSQEWRKGEQKSFVSSDGQRRFFKSIYEFGGWKLCLDAERRKRDLGDQLAHWVSVLRPKAAELKDLRERGSEIELNCGVFTSTTGLVKANHKLLGELSNLGVDLTISFFAHEDGNDVA